jgi:hypothetical protein
MAYFEVNLSLESRMWRILMPLEKWKLFVPASMYSADELLVIAFKGIRKILQFLSETNQNRRRIKYVFL